MEAQEINQEIEKPTHYGSKSGQDVIDVAEDFGLISNAYLFNVLKYIMRGGKKAGNSALQDALKADVYLRRYIESLGGAPAADEPRKITAAELAPEIRIPIRDLHKLDVTELERRRRLLANAFRSAGCLMRITLVDQEDWNGDRRAD